MKRLLFVLPSIALGWMLGCASPQVELGESGSAAAMASEDAGPRKLDVKPGTLRMRAPTPGAALRPREPGREDPPAGGEIANTIILPSAGQVAAGDRAYRLKKGDPVRVTFQGIPSPFSIEDVVDENGMITLPYLGSLIAEGRTSSELETMVFELYVPDYYRYMNVNVLMPTQRSYFAQGAVRAPGKYPYTAGITLLQAITTAGGYNDYANPKKVKVLRESQTTEYNMLEIQDNPDKDVPVEPGDLIIVPEKLW